MLNVHWRKVSYVFIPLLLAIATAACSSMCQSEAISDGAASPVEMSSSSVIMTPTTELASSSTSDTASSMTTELASSPTSDTAATTTTELASSPTSDTAATTTAPVLVETLSATARIVEFILELESPTTLESMVKAESIAIIGRTRVDAVVTVNDHMPVPDIDGRFRQELILDQGANIIEIIASLPTGEEESVVLAVIYFP